MASNSKLEIEKFNGKHFELWKLNMEDLLVDRDQWIMVDLGATPIGDAGASPTHQASQHIKRRSAGQTNPNF
jgi:hypothetical protein